MPDYYTKFSVVVKFKDTAEQKYALDLADKVIRHKRDDEPLSSDFLVSIEDDLEDWIFETETDGDGDGIWLHSEEGGIDAACFFIQHLLEKFDPLGRVVFQWSNDCSRPLLDAFGGGAAIITAKEIKMMSTAQWLHENGAFE